MDDLDLDIVDDGWRYCEKCGKGFTIWYDDFGKTEETNGYHEELDMLLCDICWARYKRE